MSDPTPWRVLDSRLAYDNAPWLRVHAQRVDTGGGHVLEAFDVLEQPDWINVVAVTDAGTVLINRQYRHGVVRVIDELPSGVVDDGETPAEACLRELREETGYRFSDCEVVATYSPNPARVRNTVTGFLARGGIYEGEQELDGAEGIAVREVSVQVFAAMVRDGRFANAMHQATGWAALARLRDSVSERQVRESCGLPPPPQPAAP